MDIWPPLPGVSSHRSPLQSHPRGPAFGLVFNLRWGNDSCTRVALGLEELEGPVHTGGTGLWKDHLKESFNNDLKVSS